MQRNPILEKVARGHLKKRPRFAVGDKVTVHVRLKEGDKERVQPFRGVVLAQAPKSGTGINATFTVRKISEGIGVERVFPMHSPFIERIEVHGSSETRRSRLFYLRSLSGKKARLKERDKRFEELIVPEPVEEETAEAAPTGDGGQDSAQAADQGAEKKADAKAEPKADAKPAEAKADKAPEKKAPSDDKK